MRIISLVPSWTETLIEAGFEVVGRTRFCIHPENRIENIPVVGGTKSVSWEKITELDPDFVLFDKEENTKEMFDECRFAAFVSHIEDLDSLENELNRLGEFIRFRVEKKKAASIESSLNHLKDFAERGRAIRLSKNENLDSWRRCQDTNEGKSRVPEEVLNTLSIPAFDWVRKVDDFDAIEKIVYVIWKKPWMAAGSGTFIYSMLEKFLPKEKLWQTDVKYPEFNIDNFDYEKTLFLFSSEPYPFTKEVGMIKKLDVFSAIVDGESFSWFGIRAIKFCERYLPGSVGLK